MFDLLTSVIFESIKYTKHYTLKILLYGPANSYTIFNVRNQVLTLQNHIVLFSPTVKYTYKSYNIKIPITTPKVVPNSEHCYSNYFIKKEYCFLTHLLCLNYLFAFMYCQLKYT